MTLGDLEADTASNDDTAGDLDDDGGELGGEAGDELDIYDDADFGLEPTVKRGRDPAGRRTVEFEVTPARQARFFDMEDGREAVLHVTCLGTEGEWQRLRVRRVIWKRR